MTESEFNQIVEEVLGWFKETSKENQDEFRNLNEESLISYHNSLGREIRNEFGLWKNSWTPELVDGIDVSPSHPDSVSMSIIKEVWKRVQNA